MLERLLDSVILIDHFNSVPQATEFILALDPEKTAISVISYAEIMTGLDEEGGRKARPLLQSFGKRGDSAPINFIPPLFSLIPVQWTQTAPDIFLDKIFLVVNNHVEDSPDESIWRVVYEFWQYR